MSLDADAAIALATLAARDQLGAALAELARARAAEAAALAAAQAARAACRATLGEVQ